MESADVSRHDFNFIFDSPSVLKGLTVVSRRVRPQTKSSAESLGDIGARNSHLQEQAVNLAARRFTSTIYHFQYAQRAPTPLVPGEHSRDWPTPRLRQTTRTYSQIEPKLPHIRSHGCVPTTGWTSAVPQVMLLADPDTGS